MTRLFLTLTLVLIPWAHLQAAETIVIKGSDTLGAILMPPLQDAFRAKHPEVNFETSYEGSQTGIMAVTRGDADIGMSSREAQPEERANARSKDVVLMPVTVAHDGIAIIVNEKNPIRGLRASDVERIFTGEVTDWAAVRGRPGTISVYTRNTASGTYKAFQELAMNKRNYGPKSQKLTGNEQIAAEVANNPQAIGYVGLAYADTPGVKVVPIDGVTPTQANILDDEYAYARPLYYFVNGFPTRPVVAEFLNFTLSSEGQKIVAEVHFVPLQ